MKNIQYMTAVLYYSRHSNNCICNSWYL